MADRLWPHGPAESWPTRCRPEWFAGLPVLVAGLGKSGRAAARHLADAGADVVACDDNPDLDAGELAAFGVKTHLGPGAVGLLEGRRLLVVAPGLPEAHPLIQAALAMPAGWAPRAMATPEAAMALARLWRPGRRRAAARHSPPSWPGMRDRATPASRPSPPGAARPVVNGTGVPGASAARAATTGSSAPYSDQSSGSWLAQTLALASA